MVFKVNKLECFSKELHRKSIGYLSGAPRVSTRPEAGAAGPRTHVLGVMNAFERLGWEVKPYIVGDRVPLRWVAGETSDRALRGSVLKRIAADFVRPSMGMIHGWWASKEIGAVDWVYERYGAFQSMGWWFQRKGIPWILETNELYYVNATEDRKTASLESLLRMQERWAYRQCDVLVCISQPLADLIEREIGISHDKIIVLPNGVDTKRMDPAMVQPRRLHEGPTLGFVGLLQKWQRIDMLLDVMAGLREEGINYYLCVVGDGTMLQPLQKQAMALRITDQVRFLGRMPWGKIPDYIAGFDLGYSGAVSQAAGFMYRSPLKLYEYAAMGKPVVTADYTDARQLVGDGVAGYLFKPGDREDLRRALRQAYAERQNWGAAGAHGSAIVAEKHSWEARVSELIFRAGTILEGKFGSMCSRVQ